MKPLLPLLLLVISISACTKRSNMQITKSDNSVTVTSPEFQVTVPGKWTDSKKASRDVIYEGFWSDQGISKHLILSKYNLENGPDPEGSRFAGFVSGFRDVEKSITKNKAEIIDIPIHAIPTGFSGGYIGIHPSAGRVVFFQAFGDDKTSYNVYYELEGYSSAPDVSALYTQFRNSIQSAKFTSKAEQGAAANP